MSVYAQLKAAKEASRQLVTMTDDRHQEILIDLADSIKANQEAILKANEQDLSRMDPNDPRFDRLKLTPDRLTAIASDIRNIAAFESPLGKILESRTLENGLNLERVAVPIGVIGIVYEARPNVTFDVFSLCFKSGNSCALKGGKDAADSNHAIVSLIHSILKKHNVTPDVVQLLPPAREAVEEMLSATDVLDVVIPRGSKALIDFVRSHSKVPVIETGAGVVHTYLDKQANLEAAKDVIFNAKTRRVSVCNALDTLLVHKNRTEDLASLIASLADQNVELYADDRSYDLLKKSYPENLLHKAKPEDYGQEFLDYKMSIRIVENLEEALEHIAAHSSRHSEAILSDDEQAIEAFLNAVDAAVVYANTSTAFTDGAQFGLGAEVGISTQKLPPRGPMGLRDLTTYKWKVRGKGQTRP